VCKKTGKWVREGQAFGCKKYRPGEVKRQARGRIKAGKGELKSMVADPDRINLSCWIRIRIQNVYPDVDPGGKKCPIKIKDSSCFEVLDVLF
jgi:hypothetical protein